MTEQARGAPDAPTELTLYGIAASRTSRPLWMLEELGVPYRHIVQDYKHSSTRQEAFLAINPNGHIPVLIDGDIVVWESMATTLYLAQRFPGPLSPGTPYEHAQVLRWTFWVVSECEKDALQVLFHRVVMTAARRDESLAAQAEKRLHKPLSVLESHLADHVWLAGDRFTVADINVASVIDWARPIGLKIRYPRLADWLSRCLARDAQQRVREMARSAVSSDK